MKVVTIFIHDDAQASEVSVTGMTDREAAMACHHAWEALSCDSYDMVVVRGEQTIEGL